MTRTLIGILVAASLCSYPRGTVAQETRHPMYIVRSEFVKPAETAAYETATKRWLSELTIDDVTWVTIYGHELGYAFVVPIENFAALDEVRLSFGTTSRTSPDARWAQSAATAATPVERVESYVIELRPDLSYLQRTVSLDATLPFRKYHWYHAIPGREAEFEAVVTSLVELYRARDVDQGFLFYEVVIGDDLPVFLRVERADDEAHYAAQASMIRETLGDQADALFGRLLEYTRHVEVMEGAVRSGLSYPPPSQAASSREYR